MPYVLSPTIPVGLPGLWGEGPSYERSTIYDLAKGEQKSPPVRYAAHTLKPHSVPHVDFPAHILLDGATADSYFANGEHFFGPTIVLRLPGERWKPVASMPDHYLWEISEQELQDALKVAGAQSVPDKVFITAANAPLNEFGFHDSRYVLVLSKAAAELLVKNPEFNAYGTSWKSSDFQPGSRERPIHKILLQQAVLFEQLKLDHVPQGSYFLSAFPLALQGASESPVTPVLFTNDDLRKCCS